MSQQLYLRVLCCCRNAPQARGTLGGWWKGGQLLPSWRSWRRQAVSPRGESPRNRGRVL